MIYLDYSATTPVNREVLDTFIQVTERYFGNPNSLHKLGLEAKRLIDASTRQIAGILGVKEKEIIYTSGATEANNMALLGVALKYKNRGNHIITTDVEHSSISEVLKYLESEGFKVSYVKLNQDGQIDLEDLERLLTDDTILVSFCSINSETGIRQNLKKIGKILSKYPKVIFHSDITQSLGKEKLDLSLVDLASFSAQKFYGLKGIGGLVKKENIEITPLIRGGKSTTIYRSGTPSPALIASTAKALRLVYTDFDYKYKKVEQLNEYLIEELRKVEDIEINSNSYSIPHIINISILNIKPETILHALEEENIYISTKTACSKIEFESSAVYCLTKSHERASHSLRISLSSLTERYELEQFIKILKKKIAQLKELN